MKTRLLYHYPCPDGVFAALAASIGLQQRQLQQSVVLVPNTVYQSEHETSAMLDTFGPEDEVYLLDFSGNHGFLARACARVASVHLLDHHKTAADDLAQLDANGSAPANLERVVDMGRSGAMIAYDYFGLHKTHAHLRPIYEHIQDQDLWRFRVPGTKSFSAALTQMDIEYDFAKNPALAHTLQSLDVAAMIATGTELLEEQARRVAAIVATKYLVTIPAGEGQKALTCFGVTIDPSQSKLRSEVGNALAEESKQNGHSAAGAVISSLAEEATEPDMWKVSLRSIGDVDTTVFTKFHGGGGHKNASSCMVKKAVLDRFL